MKHLRLICAVIVAVIYSTVTWNRPWSRVRDFVLLLRNSWRDELVSGVWLQNRMDACRNCPVFYRPLRTCGSPLRKELRDVGCFCSMEWKARLSHATCWLRDHETHRTGFGWRDGL